ncbi:MAG: altronate dehydratase family protein [Defluviitaleaceae bacterium]|nr:altronate dehydratase family protein [Defluviitaleaceae bacterium]
MENTLTINHNDNVAVALKDMGKIPAGHKIATSDIAKGENVIKYGYPIGHALCEIKSGDHVHTHNIKTNLSGIIDYSYVPEKIAASSTAPATFMGYERSDGSVGIRNEVWVINTVGCVNKIAEKLCKLSGADDVFTFVHPYGCSQLGDDHEYTRKILCNMVNHPNAAGVLVLGLGCENNHISDFKKLLGTWDDKRVKFLNTQDVTDEIAEGLKLIRELKAYADTFTRKPIPVGRLVVGLKCGGSDGFSGVTANVLVGRFSDDLIAQGGISVLTEVPEMFGAETLLMNRAADTGVFDKTVSLVNDFKNYFMRHNQEIYENPSPGNKDGGISTLEEKSLGCTQKGGTSYVTDVLGYGETCKTPGLNLLQGPGNDIVAVTNLMAAGVHIVLFTTGRGTPLGAPVPTVKISSNTKLSELKPHWIDFDAGQLLDGVPLDNLARDFAEYIIEVASGKTTRNEENDYREISIFKDGVTL